MQDMAAAPKDKDAQLYKVLVIGDYAVGASAPGAAPQGPGARSG